MLAWVYQAASEGLALVENGRLVASNPTFDRLERSAGAKGNWSLIPADLRAGTLPCIERYASLRELVVSYGATLAADRGTTRARFTRGGQVIEVFLEATAMSNDGVAVVAILRDVTQSTQLEAELAAIRACMVQQQSLRATEELAAGIGHDLGNLLAALKLRIETLAHQRVRADGWREHLQAVARMAEFGNTLVGKLEATAGPADASPMPVELDEVVRAAVDLVQSVRRPRAGQRPQIRVVVRMAGLPPVLARPEELQRVFLNLLLNARDAMPQGGTVTVRGKLTSRASVVYVEDEGMGIPREHLSRVFDLYYSTKTAVGSGIGLTVARSVMRGLGGSISARNRPSGGACFELRFPHPPARATRRLG